MGTAELISWLSLGIGFVGSWGTLATHSALRRLGSLATSVGLTVFCLAGLYTVLHAPLADHPFFLVLAAFPVLAAVGVLAAAAIAGWLTRFFNRDVEPDPVQVHRQSDTNEILR